MKSKLTTGPIILNGVPDHIICIMVHAWNAGQRNREKGFIVKPQMKPFILSAKHPENWAFRLSWFRIAVMEKKNPLGDINFDSYKTNRPEHCRAVSLTESDTFEWLKDMAKVIISFYSPCIRLHKSLGLGVRPVDTLGKPFRLYPIDNRRVLF